MEPLSLFVSFVGGGAVGGLMNVLYQWRNRQKDLRTKFYPVISNMNAAYLIRMEQPRGKDLVQVQGQEPLGGEREFVDHRAEFIMELIQYNDLREVIILRQRILDNHVHNTPGILKKTDLVPEAQAIDECMRVLHKKLKLDPLVT